MDLAECTMSRQFGIYNFPYENGISYGEEVQGNNLDSMKTSTNIVENEGERPTINSDVGGSSGIYGTSSKGYAHNNKFYYNDLNNYSKAIYDALANNIENLKTGTYKVEINYDFNSLLKSSGGQDELSDYYSDAVNALNLDIPDLFYIDFNKMFLKINETTTLFNTKYSLSIDSDYYPNYLVDEFQSKDQINSAIAIINNAKNQAKTGAIRNRLF